MKDKKSKWLEYLEVLESKGIISKEHIDKERLDFLGQKVRVQYSSAHKEVLEVEGISFGVSELLDSSGNVVWYSMELAIEGGRVLNIDIASIILIEILEVNKEIDDLRKEVLGNKKDNNCQFR